VKWRQVGHEPAWIAAAAGGHVSRVAVALSTHQQATKVGASGLLITVRRADSSVTAGSVRLKLNYAGFAKAYGGGYGSRLALFAMPACALSTPLVRHCRSMAPVQAVNDWRDRSVSAVVTAAASGKPAVVYALSTTTSGGTGDYKATSLAPSSLWQVGLQTGDFSWSYPMRVPPAIGGSAPSLSLSYASGATDGETAQDNSQPGQIGEGFSLSGSVGFIERRYVSCGDLITGTVSGSPNNTNQTYATGDECWDGENAYLSLDGVSTELVTDGTNWRLEGDTGASVQFLSGASNGAYQGQYWEIIQPDGTQYYFGLGELPGYQSGNTQTNSVWMMPVFGLGQHDPCHNASYASSYCANMPWRWNLDLVVDPNGNATSYYYNTETNYYATDSYFDTNNGQSYYGTAVQYDSGGTLSDIYYGMQDTSSSSPDSGGNVYAHKAFNIHFTYVDRCSLYGTDDTYNTDYSDTATATTCNQNETETSGDWPDTPWDLTCSSASNCTGAGHDAPAFFDTQMLATITTNVEQGFNNPEAVDTWTLGYYWKSADVNADLVLAAIIHAGDVGSGSITLPAVSLGWTQMDNRVSYGEDYPTMYRYRLTSINSETDAETDITYNAKSCSSTEQTDPSSNTLPCFPQYWSAGDFGGAPTVLWFYKYTVASVVVNDELGGEPAMPTYYTYCNNAACTSPNTGAAWHYDTDVDLVPTKDKSWAEWRGYQYVQVVTGASGDTQSETDYTFLRGMSGDSTPQSGGGFTYPTVTVAPSRTTGSFSSVTDANALNGVQLEKITYDGLNTAGYVSDDIDWPWLSPPTVTSATEPWGQPLTGELTGTAETDDYYPLSGGGTRHTQTTNTYDNSTGLVTEANDMGDFNVPSQEYCTAYTYPSPASPATANLLNYPTEVRTTACGVTGSPVVSDTKYYYDGQAWGTAPISGNVTETDVYSSGDTTTSGNHWIKQSQDGYDSYGRLVSSENAGGFTTTTAYSSSFGTGYAMTSTTVHSPLTGSSGENTTTTVNPEWGTPATVTDPDNERTDYAYDALGRVTAVWLPGQAAATPSQDNVADANYAYSYSISPTKATAPYVETTRLLTGNDIANNSYEVFDSLLRVRQVQTQADGASGGSEVTDTYYDSRGNTVATAGPYNAGTNASGSVWNATLPQIPDVTQNTYDGDNREIETQLSDDGTVKWDTTWTYSGADEVTEVPPAGGTITATYTDALGRTTEIDQYHSKTAPSGPYDATDYTYDPVTRQLHSVTDAGGNSWDYSYDILGRQLTATTPDAGTTTNKYNDLGQLTSVTDSAGNVVSYTYDAAGRKTAEYASSPSGQTSANELAAWTYDQSTITNGTKKAYGLPYAETSYVGGTSGGIYTKTIGSYNQLDNPTSTTYTIPSSSLTGALAGTYTLTSSYNLADDSPNSIGYPAAGQLLAETLNYVYDNYGNPYSAWSRVSDYVTGAFYQYDNQPVEFDLGTGTSPADLWSKELYYYDPATLQLSEAATQVATQQGNNPPVWTAESDVTYGYDNSGNLTSATDATNGYSQCYTYDYLARLTAAWTQTSSNCPSSAPGASSLGGPSPYEQTLTYNTLDSNNVTTGNITGTTLITGSGSTATTTTTSYQYPAAGSSQPHAATQVSTSINGGTATNATQTWTSPGQLAGSTGGATTTSYNWNGTGAAPDELFSAVTAGTTSRYRYDADGNLLVVQDGSTSTLYLPGEEVVASGSTVTATRYYTFDNQVVAVRTPTDVYWLLSDPQGTDTELVDTSDQNVDFRYYTPFGDLLSASGSATWPGNRGYVGGTTDATSGLTNLGAREYNPLGTAFISPDPVLEPDNPSDLDPYDYAFNNPATDEDPSGQLGICITNGDTCQPNPGTGSYGNPSGGEQDPDPGSGNGDYGGDGGSYGGSGGDYGAGGPSSGGGRSSSAIGLAMSGIGDWASNQALKLVPTDVACTTHAAGGCPARRPDYYSFNLTVGPFEDVPVVFGANITVTRDHAIYFGPEVGFGTPGISASARNGWILQRTSPSNKAIDNYAQGFFATADGYYPAVGLPLADSGVGPSVGGTWGDWTWPPNWQDFSTEVGVSVGAGNNFSATVGYDWRIG